MIRLVIKHALFVAAFIIGIGIVATTFRLFGIWLTDTKPEGSSWQTPSASTKERNMF